MNSPPDAVYATVRDTDPDTLEPGELDGYLRQVAALRAWCDARQVRATRRQRELAAAGRGADPRHVLTNHGRQSSKDAHTADEREAVCSAMPGFEDALSAGAVSSGHIDAVANATRHLDEQERAEFATFTDELLTDAGRQSVDTFARNCRDVARDIRARNNAASELDELELQRRQSKISRWVDRRTGMCSTLIEADPVTDREIWRAIQRERGRLQQRNQRSGTKGSWDRLTVDALVAAVQPVTAGASGATPRSGSALVVHIGVGRLLGETAHGLCETDSGVPVPIEVARRLACEAEIIPIVLGCDGVVLDHGRGRRLASAAQRTAIEAMQRTCSHPDCTVTIDDCRIHHVVPWELGGTTDLANLAAVCEVHHHLVHEGGWTLTMTPDRIATWTRPDGTVSWTGPMSDRSPGRESA